MSLPGQHVVSVRLKVYRNKNGNEVNAIEFQCSGGDEKVLVTPNGGRRGGWGAWRSCPDNMAVTGVSVIFRTPEVSPMGALFSQPATAVACARSGEAGAVVGQQAATSSMAGGENSGTAVRQPCHGSNLGRSPSASCVRMMPFGWWVPSCQLSGSWGLRLTHPRPPLPHVVAGHGY